MRSNTRFSMNCRAGRYNVGFYTLYHAKTRLQLEVKLLQAGSWPAAAPYGQGKVLQHREQAPTCC